MPTVLATERVPSRRMPADQRVPVPLRSRLASGGWLASALVLVGLAMAWNLQGFPGRVNDDEGTYVDRAWGMIALHHLSNYTYYWDHPFLGWATIAAWATVTDGFARDSRAIMAGRELMWLATMISGILLYVMARRIDIRRPFAASAVVLFGLSPIDIWYHRMISLDNLATVWVLAAFVLAMTRRRSWVAAVGSGACFAIAFWNKETILLLLPSLIWLIWRNADQSTRLVNLCSFCVVCVSGVAFYPLLAILKGEMLPGPGHVSLWTEQVVYQLTRPGTGSLLNRRSGTWLQFHSWLVLDTWLILGGCIGLVAGFAIYRLRPFALVLVLQVAVMVKGGYVPYAFITSMLPFMALLAAGTADTCWRSFGIAPKRARKRPSRVTITAWHHLGKVPVIAVAVLFAVAIAPRWFDWLQQQSTIRGFSAETAAVSWVNQNVPPGQIVVCDAYPWLDIMRHTHATPVYLWQINYDSQVMRTKLPHGYRSISYLVLEPKSALTLAALPGRPTLQQALKNSEVVRTFGSIDVYRVKNG